jgi:hypothetical protein
MTFSNALYFIYQVHLTEEETSGGLQIIPTEKSITVPNAPVLVYPSIFFCYYSSTQNIP